MRLSYIVMDPPSSFDAGHSFLPVLEYLRELGYEGIELNMTQAVGFDADRFEGWLESCDMALPSFLTGGAYGDGLCLSSRDADVRRRTVERLVQYVDTAARFGSFLVVGLLQGFRSDEPNPHVANERIADCLRDVAGPAGEAGVDVVIEPVNHLQVGFNNSVAEVRALIERIGSPAVRPMVDTIHMNIEEKSLTQPIRDLGPALRHVHLCESNAGPLGSGRVDFGSVVRALESIEYLDFASVKIYRGTNMREDAKSAASYLAGIGAKPA